MCVILLFSAAAPCYRRVVVLLVFSVEVDRAVAAAVAGIPNGSSMQTSYSRQNINSIVYIFVDYRRHLVQQYS